MHNPSSVGSFATGDATPMGVGVAVWVGVGVGEGTGADVGVGVDSGPVQPRTNISKTKLMSRNSLRVIASRHNSCSQAFHKYSHWLSRHGSNSSFGGSHYSIRLNLPIGQEG